MTPRRRFSKPTRPGIGKVRSSAVANQDDIHRLYGGIVPELASRNHVVTMMPIIERAMAEAGCKLGDIGGIAVTRGPGLVGSLLVGLMCAKGLAQATGIPFVGVNHIEGHLLAPLLEHEIAMPYLALVVSGGHTALFVVEDFGRYRRLGSTRDDAAGEAFDKVAKLMGLGYPGGKIIDDISKRGHRKAVKIPRAHVKGAPMDFSFSGVKTAVANFLRSEAGAATCRRGSRGELPGSGGRHADPTRPSRPRTQPAPTPSRSPAVSRPIRACVNGSRRRCKRRTAASSRRRCDTAPITPR